ncbi:hypothetical protein FOMPIDRAFT_1048008 [Fomitopsis schrenkii]|uniref:Uncharacterized protein n=1 Tax=Fomitopsis schrenkii TaxID=2126942 RepID=S8EGI7_FOMSC|nr:hypothetical protein FOMPIDRAFT_1048008 [Fomitopsis schrenkii]
MASTTTYAFNDDHLGRIVDEELRLDAVVGWDHFVFAYFDLWMEQLEGEGAWYQPHILITMEVTLEYEDSEEYILIEDGNEDTLRKLNDRVSALEEQLLAYLT